MIKTWTTDRPAAPLARRTGIAVSTPAATVDATGPAFACSVFDWNWFVEFEDGTWGEPIAETLTGWVLPEGTVTTRMCVRFVGFCNDAAGEIAAQHVRGMNPTASVQLTEAGYIALAAPYRLTGPGQETVIALRFWGTRQPHASPTPPYRPCTGSTDRYQVFRRP